MLKNVVEFTWFDQTTISINRYAIYAYGNESIFINGGHRIFVKESKDEIEVILKHYDDECLRRWDK